MGVLRVGFAAGVTGCSLCWHISQASVQRSAELVRAGHARSCTCPLQGQAQQHQEGKQAGTHRLWIIRRCWFWQVNRRPSAAILNLDEGMKSHGLSARITSATLGNSESSLGALPG